MLKFSKNKNNSKINKKIKHSKNLSNKLVVSVKYNNH